MKNKILIFDDIIDLEYQERIKNILTGERTFEGYFFPWYFTQDVTRQKDKNSQKRSAFFHGYVMNDNDDINAVGTIDSVFHYLFTHLIENVCNKIGKQPATGFTFSFLYKAINSCCNLALSSPAFFLICSI